MNIERLQALWNAQVPPPAVDEAALVEKIKLESHSLDRTIRRRDWREFGAGVVLAGLWMLPGRADVGPRWPQLLAVLLALLVPVFAIAARRRLDRQRGGPDFDVQRDLDHGIEHTRLQISLLQRVAWWYLLPLWVAGLLMEYHRHGEIAARWWKVQAWWVVPFCLFVYWLNQQAVQKNLLPKLDRLLALRGEWSQLDAGAPPTDANETRAN